MPCMRPELQLHRPWRLTTLLLYCVTTIYALRSFVRQLYQSRYVVLMLRLVEAVKSNMHAISHPLCNPLTVVDTPHLIFLLSRPGSILPYECI